jgi:hypothetical protein
MNWETIVTGVLTGVIASAITGYLGVMYAFKQFRQQRAFDRQLDWHEKTTQAVFEFLGFNETVVFALKNDRPDLLEELVNTTGPLVKEFQKSGNNSLLYANRDLYLRLKEVGKKLQEITEATGKLPGTGGQPTELYQSNVKLLDQTLFELAKPIRKMLDLDTLSLADFEK